VLTPPYLGLENFFFQAIGQLFLYHFPKILFHQGLEIINGSLAKSGNSNFKSGGLREYIFFIKK